MRSDGEEFYSQQMLEEYQQWLADPQCQAEYLAWLSTEKGNQQACELLSEKEDESWH